jgi:DNA-binding GntR family transcriptional regulator
LVSRKVSYAAAPAGPGARHAERQVHVRCPCRTRPLIRTNLETILSAEIFVNQSVDLERVTVTKGVADLLRRRIITGYYKGGHQMRQEAIAAELGVSRIPVREALLQLVKEGLATYQPHKGATVARLSVKDAQEIFDARYLLEPAVTKAAMLNANEMDIERIRVALKDYEAAVKARKPPDELSRLNWIFHTTLCEPADRPRTMAILAALHNAADRYLRLQINFAKAQKRAVIDHRKIFAACQAKDQRSIVKLLQAHISNARDDVMDRLRGLKESDADQLVL